MQVRAVLANGKFWSGILCAASVSRGSAYIERPPVSGSLAVRAIETFISYPVWGIILLVTAGMIAIAHLLPSLRWSGVIGHSLSILAYGTFGLSLGVTSIFSEESWANTGLYLVGACLHFACAIYMADEIAKHKSEVKD